jgi:hypothetical protein
LNNFIVQLNFNGGWLVKARRYLICIFFKNGRDCSDGHKTIFIQRKYRQLLFEKRSKKDRKIIKNQFFEK